MTGATFDALARQPALDDPVRPELVPVRAVRWVTLDDDGHAVTVPRAADTGPRSCPRRPAVPDLFPGSAPTEAKRAWRALWQSVVLPGVRRGLDLGHVLTLFRVEVIQPAGGTGRVGLIQSPRFIGVVSNAWRALHLANERCSR